LDAEYAVKIGDSSVILEWDTWEDRQDAKPVWPSCANSIFVSCGFNESVFDTVPDQDLEAVGELSPSTAAAPHSKEKIPIHDYFSDLELDKSTAPSGSLAGRSFMSLFAGPDRRPNTPPKRAGVRIVAEFQDVTPIHYGMPLGAPVGPRLGLNPFLPGLYIPLYGVILPIFKAPRDTPIHGMFHPFDPGFRPVPGMMITRGLSEPDFFTPDLPGTFGSFLPPMLPSPGVFIPDINLQSRYPGLMVPHSPDKGYFLHRPDTYPAVFQPDDIRFPPVKGSVLNYPPPNVRPHTFIPDNMIARPFGYNVPLTRPIHGTMKPLANNDVAASDKNPLQPVRGSVVPKPSGMNKFIPDSMGFPATFQPVDNRIPPLNGFYIPGIPGYPDILEADDDESVPVKLSDAALPGVVIPHNDTFTQAPPNPGVLIQDLPFKFVPRDKGSLVTFKASNLLLPDLFGVLIPVKNGIVNLFYPQGPVPYRPGFQNGLMLPANSPNTLKGTLVLTNYRPLRFIPEGFGSPSQLQPEDSNMPAIRGVYLPPAGGMPPSFIPDPEDEGKIVAPVKGSPMAMGSGPGGQGGNPNGGGGSNPGPALSGPTVINPKDVNGDYFLSDPQANNHQAAGSANPPDGLYPLSPRSGGGGNELPGVLKHYVLSIVL